MNLINLFCKTRAKFQPYRDKTFMTRHGKTMKNDELRPDFTTDEREEEGE